MQKKGRFPPEWIHQLKSQISLVDIASENIDLKKTGNRFMGRCPFHGDRTPSFSVNKDFYYCFGCKETGDVISFVTKLQGLSFEEACEDLAEKANLKIPEGELSSEEERALYQRRLRTQKAARLNHFASLQFYHQNLIKPAKGGNPLFQEARDYLKKRGITQKTIEQFQIGVSGTAEGLPKFLEAAKAPLEIAREYGLIRPSTKQAGDYDVLRERLLFPLIDMRGRVAGFGGRILPSTDHGNSPKYLNSSESELFQKSRFLYGLFQAKRAIREEEVAIVVEGYFDTVAMHQAGIEYVVATCGTSLTEDHLRTLGRLAKKIIVFFDQDNAGITATIKAMELGLKNGILIYGISFESKLDVDEFLLQEPEAHLAKLKEWISKPYPLLDFLIDQELKTSKDDVELRSQAIKKITHWLESYTDVVGRSLRVDQLIQKWRIPAQALGQLGRMGGQQHARPAPRPPGPAPQSSPQVQGARQNPSPSSAPRPPVRRGPIKPNDRQLLQFLVKFNEYGQTFLAAKKLLPEKDSLSVFFDDTEIQNWVTEVAKDPTGFSRLRHAPETLLEQFDALAISQELRSVIMEGLLQETVKNDEEQLQALLKKGIYKGLVRFSHTIQRQIASAETQQDTEKVEELSKQFLDVQIKLNEFKDSYVSGKTSDDSTG